MIDVSVRRLFRPVMAAACIFLLVAPGSGQPLPPVTQELINQLPKDKTLAVKLRTGAKIKGRLISTAASSFEFQPEKKTVFESRPAPVSVAYEDVQSVKPAGHDTLRTYLIVFGVGAAIMGVGVWRGMD